MKKIKRIEIFYDDESMEQITPEQEIFKALVEEIDMTKTLFDTADNINKKYNEFVEKI